MTDVSGIDTSVPGTYPLVISYGGREEDVVLTISDTTAPVGEAVPKSIYLGDELPSAEEFVTDLYDLSGNVNVDFETVPDINAAGGVDVTIKLFDPYGNESEILSTLDIIDDFTGPTVYAPGSLTVMPGDYIDLVSVVAATDDYDADPEISIDVSGVNFSQVGVYTLVYIATDDAGNSTRKEVMLTVMPPEGEEFNDYVYQMADDILDTIKCSKKTKTARAIFEYVHDNMTYDSSNFGASTPEEAAFIGFTTHTGNCYIYASCCKILLDRAGITSMFITRSPITTSGHYWLLVRLIGKWWHCDATPFKGHEGIYFMLIDSQLDQYPEFDPSKYPARSTTPSGMAVGACVGQAKDYSATAADPAAEVTTGDPLAIPASGEEDDDPWTVGDEEGVTPTTTPAPGSGSGPASEADTDATPTPAGNDPETTPSPETDAGSEETPAAEGGDGSSEAVA